MDFLVHLSQLGTVISLFLNNKNLFFLCKFFALDNYFKEAYPNIVYTNLKPIFESINIPFIVRNSAIGNNPCYPYDACIATQVGDDLDILTWEQVSLHSFFVIYFDI